MSLKDRALFEMVRVLPRRALTLGMGRVAQVPIPEAWRERAFTALAGATGAICDEAGAPLSAYRNLNELFTRELRPGVRPLSSAAYTSPADGRVDQVQRVASGALIQAKGIEYGVGDLVGDAAFGASMEGALSATVYLSPGDYHRVHVPSDVTFDRVTHLGGELWPVNGTSVARVDRLFARNERVAATFVDRDGRRGAVVMVAATVVGGIVVAEPSVDVTRRHNGNERADFDVTWEGVAGAWFGTFLLGSTVVVVVEGDDLVPAPSVIAGAKIRVGESLFVRR